jgi:hypothetical protein
MAASRHKADVRRANAPPRIAPARPSPQQEEDDSGVFFFDEVGSMGDPSPSQPAPVCANEQSIHW